MEQSLSDLLSDAFSDTSAPSFPDDDLDFENLNFDEKLEEENSHENLQTKEDRALHQEATGEATVLSTRETKDIYKPEHVDEEQSDDNDDDEDFQGVGVSLMSVDETPEEDYTSSDGDSEQEGSVSGEDEEDGDEEEDIGTGEKGGDLLMSVRCGDESCYGYKEDRIFAEGHPLSPEGAENPQVRNEEQGESESDEEVSYFGRIPERGNEMMMIKGDGVEEDEQEREEDKQDDSSDSECEGMKVEQEENVLAQCFEQVVENPYRGEPATATLNSPEISVQSLQDPIAVVVSEEYVEKMKDFSGEEHQEAGESFADYPSDFSSCEYVDGVKNQESNSQSNALPHTSYRGSNAKQNICLEGEVTDATWMGREEDTDDDEGDGYLFSRDLEMDDERFRSFDVAAAEEDGGKCENVLSDAAVTGCDDGAETGESDSYSSSDDEVQVRRRDEGLLDDICPQDLDYEKRLEDSRLYSASTAAFSDWSISDDHNTENNRAHPADLSKGWDLDVSKSASTLSEELLTTEGTDTAEAPLSYVIQRPAEDVNSYSVVQREDGKNTTPSNQGSVDDSFFFNTEASRVTELGHLGDDEYEEERNWEQEQERIKAFYKFYNESDGENERERQIKVQFCTDPLSQVIHYETDSDTDSLSSFADREEDLSSAETPEDPREPDDTLLITPDCDPPNTLPESAPESAPESVPESAPESVPETDLSNTQNCTRKHKCLGILKQMVKMGLLIGAGLLVFWMGTGQPDWFTSFF